MGMYDSVYIPCPKCGVKAELQSKAGNCLLVKYELDNAPPAILGDLSDTQYVCHVCGANISIKVTMTVAVCIEIPPEPQP
jgi:hypothetical protein